MLRVTDEDSRRARNSSPPAGLATTRVPECSGRVGGGPDRRIRVEQISNGGETDHPFLANNPKACRVPPPAARGRIPGPGRRRPDPAGRPELRPRRADPQAVTSPPAPRIDSAQNSAEMAEPGHTWSVAAATADSRVSGSSL